MTHHLLTHHILTLYSWGMKCLVLSGCEKTNLKRASPQRPLPLLVLPEIKPQGGMHARIYQVAKRKRLTIAGQPLFMSSLLLPRSAVPVPSLVGMDQLVAFGGRLVVHTVPQPPLLAGMDR